MKWDVRLMKKDGRGKEKREEKAEKRKERWSPPGYLEACAVS
jgi:hypothetical protein